MAGEEDWPEHFDHGIVLHSVSIDFLMMIAIEANAVRSSFAGTVVLMTVENTSVATEAGLLFSYYIVLSFWAAQGLGMSLLSRNVAGQTKKSVAVTMNFVAWAVGNAIGKFHPRIAFGSLFKTLTPCRASGLPILGCSSLFHRICGAHWLLHAAHSDTHRVAHYFDEAQCQEKRGSCSWHR